MHLTPVFTCFGVLGSFAAYASAPANPAKAGAAMAPTPSKPQATLKIGDPAPPVEVIKWLKGEPIDLTRGRVNVVEFWATWCGPCKASMPHLSALAAKYKDQVDFTGIAVWENAADPLAAAESFVAHAGNSMTYNVGYGGAKDCVMGRTWLRASNSKGIPQAFVVDKRGNIAWIGGPMEGLEEALALAVQDKLDASAAAKVDLDFKALLKNAKSLTQQINLAAQAGNLEKFAKLVHQKTSIEAFNADEIVASAYTTLANAHGKLAAAYSDQIMKEFGNAPDVMIAVAKEICGQGGRIKKDHDYPFALELLKRAEACQETDMELNALFAQALFYVKDYENAVKRQEMAIDGLKALDAFVEEKAKSADEKERQKAPFLRKIVAGQSAEFHKRLKAYKAAAESRK